MSSRNGLRRARSAAAAARAVARTSVAAARRPAQLATRRAAVAAYLARAAVPKLQLGAGSLALDGWLNSDLRPSRGQVLVDATRRFPFADGTFAYVFSEHQIEHITYADGLSMLREAHRVLRPDGRLRVATPDLERLLALLRDRDDPVAERYVREIVARFVRDADEPRPAFAVNSVLYDHGHRFLYDAETLGAAFERAGFVDVRRHTAGESDDEQLRGIEGHGGENPELSVFDTLVIEGRRAA